MHQCVKNLNVSDDSSVGLAGLYNLRECVVVDTPTGLVSLNLVDLDGWDIVAMEERREIANEGPPRRSTKALEGQDKGSMCRISVRGDRTSFNDEAIGVQVTNRSFSHVIRRTRLEYESLARRMNCASSQINISNSNVSTAGFDKWYSTSSPSHPSLVSPFGSLAIFPVPIVSLV